MHLIHRRDVIREAPKRWLEQYARHADDERTGWNWERSFGDVRRALGALDTDTCSAADITAAMGGGSGWGNNECDECERDVETLVHIGDEPDYDMRWQVLCGDCLASAIALLASLSASAAGATNSEDKSNG